MMLRFSALHTVAARRGDGLRPELVRLLERSRARAELSDSNADLPGSDLLREDVQRFLTNG